MLSPDSQSRTAPGLSGGTPGHATCYGFCQLNLINIKLTVIIIHNMYIHLSKLLYTFHNLGSNK